MSHQNVCSSGLILSLMISVSDNGYIYMLFVYIWCTFGFIWDFKILFGLMLRRCDSTIYKALWMGVQYMEWWAWNAWLLPGWRWQLLCLHIYICFLAVNICKQKCFIKPLNFSLLIFLSAVRVHISWSNLNNILLCDQMNCAPYPLPPPPPPPQWSYCRKLFL